ncbi:MAG: hypothetical protein ACKVS6_08030 [Planctomycetota bacterium]
MRRAFVFLILALAGVALLAILSGQSLSIFSGNKQKTQAYSSATSRPGTETPLTVLGSKDLAGISISEFHKIQLFGLDKTLKPFLQIEGETGKLARDKSLTITPCKISFSRDNKNSPPLEIVATRTRVEVSGMPPKLSGGEPLVSDHAVVTYFGGEKLLKTQVKISFPHLALRFQETNGGVEPVEFSSDDEFQLSGNLMKGSGKGVRGDLVNETITILQNPLFEFRPGAVEKLKDRILIKSAGKAILASPNDWLAETTIDFRDSAFFRSESADGVRFIEANANRIFMRMRSPGDTTTEETSMVPRAFEAMGDVLFRTEALEGRCSQLDGILNNDQAVEKSTLAGPYRIDFRTPEKIRTIPGLGVPKNPLLGGRGKATFVLLGSENPKARDYEMTAIGEPELTFTESETGRLASIRADKMIATIVGNELVGFRAIGRAKVRTSIGALDGDEIELIQHGSAFALRAVREYGAEFNFSENVKDKDSPRTSLLESRLIANEITIEPAENNKNVVTALGGVRGWIRKDGLTNISFRGDEFHRSAGLLELKGTVFLAAENLKLYGGRLILEDTTDTGSLSSNPLADRNATLFGSPALVEQYDDQKVLAQSLTSPKVTFVDQRMTAQNPVEVSFPMQQIAGRVLSQKNSSGSDLVWLSGSLLTLDVDANRRKTKAVLEGPISSRGALEVRGEHLELDFITGEHFLIAKEGERARVRSFEATGDTEFFAEAPRLDFNTNNESLTLIGLGTLELAQESVEFGSILKNPAGAGGSKTTVRFDTTGKVIISKDSAQFLGNVTAQGIDARGGLVWKVLCDLLTVSITVSTEGSRRPSHIRAIGNVQFSVGIDLNGTCDELESDASSEILELLSHPPRNAELDFGNLYYAGRWLKFNSRTLLVESGPAQLSSTPAQKSPASRLR